MERMRSIAIDMTSEKKLSAAKESVKRLNLNMIQNLRDATNIDGKAECSLILTEGLSASGIIESGLSEE